MSRAFFRTLSLSLLCALPLSGALGQATEDKTYTGTWSVRLQAPDGVARDATLVIDGYEGTWQDAKSGRPASKRACAGKKVPLTVQASAPRLLAFTVWGEVVAPACPTLTIALRPVNEKLLEGAADLGSHGSESPEVHASHAAPSSAAGALPASSAPADRKRVGSAGSIRMTRR